MSPFNSMAFDVIVFRISYEEVEGQPFADPLPIDTSAIGGRTRRERAERSVTEDVIRLTPRALYPRPKTRGDHWILIPILRDH
jgi:hypothetical protein